MEEKTGTHVLRWTYIAGPAEEDVFIERGGNFPDVLNAMTKSMHSDVLNRISDGYHTFGELYDHRVELFITLCRALKLCRQEADCGIIWRSWKQSDGNSIDGWFLLGIGTVPGQQITYHLPAARWEDCYFAKELGQAPEFDGHTSADVLNRLKNILG